MSVCDRPGELGSTPTGILTDGDYRETMEAVVGANPHEMRGCTDRLGGPYDMEVRAEGYRAFSLHKVEAQMDRGCGKPAQTLPIAVEMFPVCTP